MCHSRFSIIYAVALFFTLAFAGPSDVTLDLCKLGFVRCLLGGTPVVDLQKEVTKCCQSSFKTADFKSVVDDCVMNSTAIPCAEGISKKCQEMLEKEMDEAKSSESGIQSNESLQVPEKGDNCNDYGRKYRKYMIDQCVASETGKAQEYCKNLK